MEANETVKAIMADLQKFYTKKLTPIQVEFYSGQLARLDEDDLCTGIVAMKGREPVTYVPTLNTIRKYVGEAREIRLDKQKAQAPIFEDLKRNAERTQHGRDAIALMIALSEGRLTRDQYITEMFAMDRKYPNLGWAKQANELKTFWDSEAERHAAGERYFERVYADEKSDLNRRKEKLHSQAEWLKKNLGDPK